MTAVAFIGLGAMGSRMAARLLDAGHDLIVWNRTASKLAPMVERGALAAATPAAAAARAEVVITMLADPDALAAVSEGADGIGAGIRAGAAVVEMSTVGPAAIARLGEALPAGIDLIDAPVLGSLAEAEAGTLRVFAGGEEDVVRRWTPLLQTLGSVMRVGPLGSGAAAKLVANSTLFGTLGVLGEALALGRALGLPLSTTLDVLGVTPVAAQVERRRAAIESGEYPPRFTLSLAVKDASLVAEAAADAGAALKLAAAAKEWLVEAEAAGWGERDYASILAWIMERSTEED